jgi:aspartate oxidase
MKFNTKRCKETVFVSLISSHQCRRNVWKDGYCKQHHPETKAAREEKREKRFQLKLESHPLRIAYKKMAELEKENKKLKRKITRLTKERSK